MRLEICKYCHRFINSGLSITASGKPVPDGSYHVGCYREELAKRVNK